MYLKEMHVYEVYKLDDNSVCLGCRLKIMRIALMCSVSGVLCWVFKSTVYSLIGCIKYANKVLYLSLKFPDYILGPEHDHHFAARRFLSLLA